MGAPGVRVYMCPDGVNRSLYPDLRDCPPKPPISLDIGSSGTRTRFLGSRSRIVSAMELEELTDPTPKPAPLDTRKLLGVGLGAFALLILLFILTRRRKRG